jgi:hypothetical protein
MASRRFSPSERASRSSPLHHYRIAVVASTVPTLIESAGGFLCDRAREGWDISVSVCEPSDVWPLGILGVSDDALPQHVHDPASVIAEIPRRTTVAVSADLLGGNAGVRRALAQRAGDGLGIVTVCGRPVHADAEEGLEHTPHVLSVAARAFKASALRAAHIDAVADPAESLYRLRGGSFRRLYSV